MRGFGHKSYVAQMAIGLVLSSLLAAGCGERPVTPPPSGQGLTPQIGLPTATKPTNLVGTPAGEVSGLVEKLSLEELAKTADFIVVGTVRDIKSERGASKRAIYTYVRVSVETQIKGPPDLRELTVVTPGGEVEGVVESVSTAPSFGAGERVVLFLQGTQASALSVVGGFQGKYDIQDSKVMDTPLDDFVARVRQILQGK